MKKLGLVLMVAVLSGTLLYSCKPGDDKIQKSVETALSTSSSDAIKAEVKEGVVTLTGTVESQEAKSMAEQTVKGVKDVKSVVNNIQVRTPQPAVTINPDETITTTVDNALKAGGFTNVKVSVMDGEVTLTGDVKRADLEKVLQIANESKPKKVNNQLTIK